MAKENTLTKEVSVKGIRSTNAFRQNLRRAKKKAQTAREKRTHSKTVRRKRTKICLLQSKQPKKVTDKQSEKNATRKPTRTLKQNGRNRNSGRGGLSKKSNKTQKKPRRVRWRDQETGTSLVSYSESGDKSSMVVRDSPLFRAQKPLRMRFTQKRHRKQKTPVHAGQETNIVVKWRIHEDAEKAPKDTFKDVVVISDITPDEASKRLSDVGIETSRRTPPDLITRLAILSSGLGNDSVQTRG